MSDGQSPPDAIIRWVSHYDNRESFFVYAAKEPPENTPYLESMNQKMKYVARWTVGPVSKWGFDCLRRSVAEFRKIYDVRCVVCYNGIEPDHLADLDDVTLIDQTPHGMEIARGVAWKLYPPRIDPQAWELFIDNDLIIEEALPAIDRFYGGSTTLLLEGMGRHFGRYERQIPARFKINSGIFGVPPGFNLPVGTVSSWTENCPNESVTWDEQGFVASTLLAHHTCDIISDDIITNCEVELRKAPGMHFVGLNRQRRHNAYMNYLSERLRLLL